MGNRSAQTRERDLLQGDYPVLHLMSSVVFPDDVVSIQLPDEDSAAPLACLTPEQDVVATTFDGAGSPGSDMCVLCRVAQRMQIPGGGLQVVFQGLARAVVLESRPVAGVLHVRAEEIPPTEWKIRPR